MNYLKCILILASFTAFGEPSKKELMNRINDLEKKISHLQGNTPAAGGGLKVANMNGAKIGDSNSGLTESSEKIDPAKLKEIQETLLKIKKQQEESRKYLEELDNE